MTTVFISGSMRIKNIHPQVHNRIENIIKSSFDILVGDADGVDTSIQAFLKTKSYERVVVYCSGQYVRNNLGSWPVEKVFTEEGNNTRKFYTAKDIEMAKKCDYGLMVWDSKSTGTLSNVIQLLTQEKQSLVFVNKSKTFIKVSNVIDFETLISVMSDSALQKADHKISFKKKISKFKQGKLFCKTRKTRDSHLLMAGDSTQK